MRDLENRKYYEFDTSGLTKLVNYAEEGNIFRTHGDVPLRIRELDLCQGVTGLGT